MVSFDSVKKKNVLEPPTTRCNVYAIDVYKPPNDAALSSRRPFTQFLRSNCVFGENAFSSYYHRHHSRHNGLSALFPRGAPAENTLSIQRKPSLGPMMRVCKKVNDGRGNTHTCTHKCITVSVSIDETCKLYYIGTSIGI